MLDNGPGIGFTQSYASFRQLCLRRLPGRMDEFRIQLGEFWNPAADIAPVGIKFRPLQHRIENPEIGRCIRA